jgi:predicted metal-binding membrane protein
MNDSEQRAVPIPITPHGPEALSTQAPDLGAAVPPFDRAAWRARIAASIVFAMAAVYTLYATLGMTGGMRMPGGWTMEMMWMVMPGQSLLAAAATFLLMWQAMMIAMMLPSSWPMLELYARVAGHRGHRQPLLDTSVVALGYFAVWGLFGCIAFALGIEISRAAMVSPRLSQAIPGAAGVALVLSGLWQLTPWKQACLKHCRDPLLFLAHAYRPGAWGGFRVGVHHGAFCAACCWALMTMQLLLGVMNLLVMTVVAAIIAAEKLWWRGPALARVVGLASMGAGLFLILKL